MINLQSLLYRFSRVLSSTSSNLFVNLHVHSGGDSTLSLAIGIKFHYIFNRFNVEKILKAKITQNLITKKTRMLVLYILLFIII